MIRFQRAARMSRARQQEAIPWAKEVAEFLNRKYPEAEFQAFTSRFGDIARVVWQADFADLAALDAYMQKIVADQEYWELVGRTGDLFIEGSIEDTVLGSI
jgi:hypothetical protein